MDPKWIKRFLKLSVHISQWSKDPSTKVGAVIIDSQQRIISTGYNGYPRGLKDKSEDRMIKYLMTIHAETNAILYAREDLSNCAIFISAPPCVRCAGIIIQTGIARVYFYFGSETFKLRWEEENELASRMFEEAGVLSGGFINRPGD